MNTRILGADTKVYLARAGRKGHLFQQVLNSRAIGPDLPNLGLTGALLDDPDLQAKIIRSRAISKWLRTSANARGAEPSRNLVHYQDAAKGPGYAQVEGVVRTYFQGMNAGDMLVIPNPSPFGDAIIAEALPVGDLPARIPGTERFVGYQFDGRRFGHSKLVKMTDLPRAVLQLAQVPTGLAEIVNPRVKHRVFELGYDDYVFDDEFASRIITTKEDFRPFDGNVLNALVTMIAENIDRLQHREAGARLVGLEQAAFIRIDEDDLQVKININSPGYISVIARTITPLVTAVVLGVLVAIGFDAQAVTPDVIVDVSNSQVSDVLDLCSREVGQLTQSMLRFLSAEAEFQRTCDLLREAHDHTGARANVLVEVGP
ncbi:hypothetical protein [Sinorhizobium medicae]|uniref:hypothetical protein n=1 Tax=Sinorhizobium medicae TaxID=110321 RepID=UPI0012D7CB3F|nr:hypothetical protein [Sinorhizobium medicae]MDX0695429.1 hypothetical protein [Sinorhizobium medicae]MDX0744951.1 hypothetical protein [Sinorhizobium medicae]